jgi:hypothetical protein
MGLFSAMTLIMFVLKLMGTLDVSWWVVFAPVLIAFGISLVFFMLVAAFTPNR